MLSANLVELLESGCGLITGSVSRDGRPWAGRAWGLEVLDAERGTVRLLVDGDDDTNLANLAATGRLAVTGADVATLRSAQLKGRVHDVCATDEHDRAVYERYCDDFFRAVTETDGTPRALLERLRPRSLVACTFEAAEAYDQTPGPGAGAPMASSAP